MVPAVRNRTITSDKHTREEIRAQAQKKHAKEIHRDWRVRHTLRRTRWLDDHVLRASQTEETDEGSDVVTPLVLVTC